MMKLLDIFNSEYKKSFDPVIIWYRDKNDELTFEENFDLEILDRDHITVDGSKFDDKK